mgnify:CR=1 FL=1
MRLDPPATFAAALSSALPVSPMRIFTDDPASIPELREAFPGVVAQHRSEPEGPIELDATFDRALSRTLALDGGGWVNIEATRAGVMIDVDSGTPETGSPERAGLAVNLTAASAIAREIRLRNLGGGIVIDFVGLGHRGLRERVRDALAEELAPDPARPQILGWTRLGHLELVRPAAGARSPKRCSNRAPAVVSSRPRSPLRTRRCGHCAARRGRSLEGAGA